MKKRKLLWQIFFSFFMIVLVFLALIFWFASASFRQFHIKQTVRDLENNATLARQQTASMISSGNLAAIDQMCREISQDYTIRLTIIMPDGTVVGDTNKDIKLMDSHHDRPEIVEAMRGRHGMATRFSDTLQKEMVYVAVPIYDADEIRGVVRVAMPTSHIDEALRGIYGKVAMALVVSALLATFFILNTSRRISRPFEALKSDALRFVRGELKDLPESQSEEIGGLAEAINLLASRLDERTITIAEQRNEVEAILSSMVEAVLAVDSHGRILRLNKTMSQLLNVRRENARGELISDVIANLEFNSFVKTALSTGDTLVENLVMYTPQPRYLRATGTTLRDPDRGVKGAVIVLNDVTRLKQLEDIRRDFVANVSHELRTPVTSIKGFVETLESGAIDEPEVARRFMGIISKQSDRLFNIIEDLLSLSKIEQDQSEIELELKESELRGRLVSVLDNFVDRAAEKEIALELTCEEGLAARLHPNLFEQAVFNLVDNALKYSEAHTAISVRGYAQEGQLIVEIGDQGPGIPHEHLPRLFERFYRVDKARSRQVGGTGLGLSIVKHIVQAHGGSVEVESVMEKGTTFRISLPMISLTHKTAV